MPNGGDVSLLMRPIRAHVSTRMADLTVIEPKTLHANKFSAARPDPGQACESG